MSLRSLVGLGFLRSQPFGWPWRNARPRDESPAPAIGTTPAGQAAERRQWWRYRSSTSADQGPASQKRSERRISHSRVQISSAPEIPRFPSSISTSAWQRSGAHQILAVRFVRRRLECRLLHHPCAVFATTSSRPIAKGWPLAGSTDINAIRH